MVNRVKALILTVGLAIIALVSATYATVPSGTNKIQYTTNGVATTFSFPYVFYDDADLKVIITAPSTGVETILTLNTHYTVTGGDGSTGSITTTSTWASGYRLTILRELTMLQSSAYIPGGGLYEGDIQADYDRAAMRSGQIWNRGILLPQSSTLTGPLSVPVAAGNVIGWNGAGTGLITYSTSAVVTNTRADDLFGGGYSYPIYVNSIHYANNRAILSGTGDPEGVVLANTGSIYMRQDGVEHDALYVKIDRCHCGTDATNGWRQIPTLDRGAALNGVSIVNAAWVNGTAVNSTSSTTTTATIGNATITNISGLSTLNGLSLADYYPMRDNARGLVIQNATNGVANVITISFDEAILQHSTTNAPLHIWSGGAWNATLAAANVGSIHGLDTGAIAANTWYYVWTVSNGTTSGPLLSASATAPTLPSTYTYRALMGTAFVNSATDVRPFYQQDKDVLYKKTVIINSTGAVTAWTAIANATNAIPPNAKSARIAISGGGTTTSVQQGLATISDGHGGCYNNYYSGGNATFSIFSPQRGGIMTCDLAWTGALYYFVGEVAEMYAIGYTLK